MKTTIKSAVDAIKSAPRFNRGVFWAANPSLMGIVACAILGAPDRSEACRKITKATGVQQQTLSHFIRGNDASGRKCQVIHEQVAAAGLTLWNPPRRASQAASPESNVSAAAQNERAKVEVKKPFRFVLEGEFEGKKYRCYINDETKDVKVHFYYKFESKEWCQVMAHINGPKP